MSLEPIELYQQTEGGRGRGGWKSTAGEVVLSFPEEVLHKEGRTLSPGDRPWPEFLGLRKSSEKQVALDLDSQPHPPSFPSDRTLFSLFSITEATRRQSSPERQESFLLPQEFPSGCPRNISQKGKSHGDHSAAWIKPPFETHQTDFFSLPGFSAEHMFSFLSFLSLTFLKGIWGWHAEMKRQKFLY